jgi:hypothetical protein
MSKRLQVLLDDGEFEAIQETAASEGVTVSEWVRRTLRSARRSTAGRDQARKLAAVRAATRHQFPTGDIDRILAEIERGYSS